ncbi:MAG: hypothetical protein D6791_17165 [Chloroflexi bacterium]|nr:MAG: hypothetical protein D6791_17165 [Chloroflexota bacterium]
MASYFFYRLFGWLAPRIPPRVGYWLFARIGDLFYWLDADGRRAVLDNLRHVVGPDASDSILADKARLTFRMQAYNYFDLFRVPGMSAEEIEARSHVEGWEHLESAVARGQGVILVSAHFGNVDVLLQILGIRGIKSSVVMERLQPEPLFQYVAGIRGRFGTKIVPVDASARFLFRALRAGEVVVLVLDRDVTDSGVVIEFFGAPAKLPDGYARLARRTGASVVIAFGLRLPDHQLRARVEPALHVPQTDDRAGDVRAIMRQALDIAEKHIAEHPEQWVMFRPIWKSC